MPTSEALAIFPHNLELLPQDEWPTERAHDIYRDILSGHDLSAEEQITFRDTLDLGGHALKHARKLGLPDRYDLRGFEASVDVSGELLTVAWPKTAQQFNRQPMHDKLQYIPRDFDAFCIQVRERCLCIVGLSLPSIQSAARFGGGFYTT